MRPDRSHWLLVPLFALPLVVGAALAYWAARDYQSRMDRSEEQSAYWIQRALREPIPIPWWTVIRARPMASLSGPFGGRVYHLDIQRSSEPVESWRISSVYPEGPPASAFADPGRRMALELGSSDAPQPRAELFAQLLRTPDLAELRGADLPATTKLYLLGRSALETPGRAVTLGMLRLAAEVENAPGEFPLGMTPIPGGFVVRTGIPKRGSGPYHHTLIPDSAEVASVHRHVGELWSIGFGVQPPANAIWVRQVDTPVRGTWWMTPRYGTRWRDVPFYRGWILPYLGVSLAYLALPIALGLALRRRRQIDAARVRFLTEIAHDLRTPLTSVRLHAELLARSDKNRDKYLGILERESVRAGDLLGNLLDLSRLERGARKFELEPVDVAEVSSACADEFRRLYPERAEDLELTGSVDRVRADRTALARCLRNLLGNAGKYTEPGTSIRLCWSEGTLRVEDRGDGVPEPSRAFDRYVRGPNTDGISGTGLGLSLVRELVEGMGGTIQYRGGRSGAVFEIMLPKVNDA